MSNVRFEIGELTKIEEIKEFHTETEAGAYRRYRLTIKLLTVSPESRFRVEDICDFRQKVYLYAPFFDACGLPYIADKAEAAVKPDLPLNSTEEKWVELKVRSVIRGRFLSETDIEKVKGKKRYIYIGNVNFDYWKNLKSDVEIIAKWNRLMPKACYADLDQCVQCALATGNHLAFAKYFTEMAKPRKEIAAVVLKKYIDAYNDKNPEQGKDGWKQWKILKPSVWRSLNFEYTKKNLEWNAYGKTQMGKWIEIDGPIPDKDILVQLALSMGLDGNETDMLLMASGYDRLYLLDVADLFAKIALDKYWNDTVTSDYEKRKEVFEQQNKFMNSQADPESSGSRFVKGYGNKKIKYILNELEPERRSDFENGFLSALQEKVCAGEFKLSKDIVLSILGEIDKWDATEKKDNNGNVKYIDIKEKANHTHTYWRIQKQLDDFEIVVWRYEDVQIAKYNEKLSLNIEDDIRNFIKEIEVSNGKEELQETEYLTNMIGDLYKDKKVIVTDNGNISISLPGDVRVNPEKLIEQRHYGYLKKMDNFLKDREAYEKYLPENFCEWKWEWSGNVSDLVSHIGNCGRFSDKDEEKNKDEEKSGYRTGYGLNQATTIWNRRSKLFDPYDLPSASEGRSTLGNMLFGREDQGEYGKYDLITQIEKVDLLKFLVITGHEDVIGTYMKKFGFWKEDLYLKKKKTELHIEPEDFNMESCDYICDRKDLLLLYALTYRDELLNSFFFSGKTDEERNKLKQKFPFLEVVMEIANTIVRSYYLQRKNPTASFHGPWILCGAGIDGIVYSDDIMFFEEKGKRVRSAENERER